MKNSLEKIHTTELGIVRIKKNLGLDVEDVVEWCKEEIKKTDDIIKKGKNYYSVCRKLHHNNQLT